MAAADFGLFLKRGRDGRAAMDFAVEGMHCAACLSRVEGAARGLPGVETARVNFGERRLHVEWREGAADPSAAMAALTRVGYRAEPFERGADEASESAEGELLLRGLAVASFAMMNVLLLSVSLWAGWASGMDRATRVAFELLSAAIAVPAIVYAGRPFWRGAAHALRGGGLNMDVPIAVGLTLTAGLSVRESLAGGRAIYFDSALMLLTFLLAGRVVDHMARARMRRAAVNVTALRGARALRIGPDDAPVETPVGALVAGDRALVRAGDRVPADSTVIDGASEVDESLVTGETRPRPVAVGDRVHGGALNGAGALTLRVEAAADDGLAAEVQRLVEAAQSARGGYRRIADRAAALYAPVVHLAALLTLGGWLLAGAGWRHALVAAIGVLIVTCPCALALAAPAVQVVASSALFRNGVIPKNGDLIERLADVDVAVFDKTGTLTTPDARTFGGREVPELARRLALSSHHPLARALARRAHGLSPVPGAVETPGAGVRAEVNGVKAFLGAPTECGLGPEAERLRLERPGASLIAFRRGDEAVVIPIEQRLRVDARETVDALRALGLEIVIASGDGEEAVRTAADALGVVDRRAGLDPKAKVALIEGLKRAGRRPLMVGDGINDAPALAAAHASISPTTGADVSQALADAVFLGDRLAPVRRAVELSRRARRLVRQNLAFSALYNVVALPLAAAGFVSPWVAAVAMSTSSVAVMLNSLRARDPNFRADGAGDEREAEFVAARWRCC